jgi:hypothetical protein
MVLSRAPLLDLYLSNRLQSRPLWNQLQHQEMAPPFIVDSPSRPIYFRTTSIIKNRKVTQHCNYNLTRVNKSYPGMYTMRSKFPSNLKAEFDLAR